MDFIDVKNDLINGNTDSLKEILEISDLPFDKDIYFEIVSEVVRLYRQTMSYPLEKILIELKLTKDGIKFRNLISGLRESFALHNIELIENMISLCVKSANFRDRTFELDYYKNRLEVMKYDDALNKEELDLKKDLIQKSRQCADNHDLEGTIKYAHKLIEVEGPLDAVAEIKLVRSYYALGDYDNVIKFCHLGLDKCDTPMFHEFLAKVYKDKGNYIDAISEFEKIFVSNDYYVNYLLEADCYLELGDTKSALDVLNRVRSGYLERKNERIDLIDERIKQIKESREDVPDDIINDEIIECARLGNISKITEILDLLDINDKQRIAIDISVAKLLYSNKFFNKGDVLLKKVEQADSKTRLINRNLQEARMMKKVYKNR